MTLSSSDHFDLYLAHVDRARMKSIHKLASHCSRARLFDSRRHIAAEAHETYRTYNRRKNTMMQKKSILKTRY